MAIEKINKKDEMSREVPFDENEKCDNCGKKGAFDFMGDFICDECLKNIPVDEDGYFIDEDEKENGWIKDLFISFESTAVVFVLYSYLIYFLIAVFQ